MKKYILYLISFFTFFYSCSTSKIIKKENNAILFKINKELIQIEICSDEIIHVRCTDKDKIPNNKSLILEDKQWGKVDWILKETSDTFIISTSKIKVTLNKKNGNIAFFDKQNTLLLKDYKQARNYEKIEIQGEKTTAIKQLFEKQKDEALYGLGQNTNNKLNLAGCNIDLYQRNTQVFVPFLLSSKGYGLLWHNYSYSRFGAPTQRKDIPKEQLFDKNGISGRLSVICYKDKEAKQKSAFTDSIKDIIQVLNLSLNDQNDVSSAMHTGFIDIYEDGIYKIYYSGKNKFQLWLDDSLVIDYFHPFLAEPQEYPRFFSKGKHKIKIIYSGIKEHPNAYLQWRLPSDQEDNISFWSQSADAIDYYFMTGKNPDEIIAAYRKTTGTATLLPKWAMGLWQCKERYKTQEELIDVVKEYRKRKMPLDNIVQDWFYWKDDQWGSHEFDSSRFPNPSEMVMQLNNELHTQIMISVWPKFYINVKNFEEFRKNNWHYPYNIQDSTKDWMGHVYTFYDAFNMDARKLFWNQINDKLFSLGFNAWWLDASEPEMCNSNTPEMLAERTTPTAFGPGFKFFNAYPMYNSKAVYEGQRQEKPNQRVYILTRSAFAGMQKYASTTWSGDIVGSWNELKRQIPAGLNFCLSGMPYWTTDIGGFVINYPDGNENPEYRDLYTRWYQFGVFCPLFRVHGSSTPREPWFFGEKHYKIQSKFNRLRYDLMPYIYSLAGAVTHNHYTIMRALIMDFQDDKNVYNIADQYMFGNSILVNPVTDYNAENRNVYLPKSEGWYDFWNGDFYSANQTINVKTAIENMPLFVKAGSIIPFGPEIQYTVEKVADPITLRIYEGANAEFTLYEDENINYNYEKGKFATITFKWNDSEKKLTIEDRKGNFDNMLIERNFEIIYINPQTKKGYLSYPEKLKRIKYLGKEINIKKDI